jgi:hypothetical protein
VLIDRRILATIFLLSLAGVVSPSYGNILVFPGGSNQPQVYDLDANTGYFQQALYVQQSMPEVCVQNVPCPVPPLEPLPEPRFERWLASCQGMGSAESFQPTGGSGQASLPDAYKFYLPQPLSWSFCGEKPILPAAPLENFLKVPIC